MITGWHLSKDSWFGSTGARWQIGRDGSPIGQADEPPRELASWCERLNADRTDGAHTFIVCEKSATDNADDPIHWNRRADDRGRWVVAVCNGKTERAYAMHPDTADEHAPGLSALLHQHFGTRPASEIRAEQERAEAAMMRQVEAERKQQAEDDRQRLLREVTEALITPSIDSIETALPALRRLLGVRP